MATLQASSFCSSSSSSSSSFRKIKTNLNIASKAKSSDHLYFPRVILDELNRRNGLQTFKPTSTHSEMNPNIGSNIRNNGEAISSSKLEMRELYTIMGIVADRAEMHKNIGDQRDDWNRLLLNSVNGMTLTGATMAGLSAVSTGVGPPILALNLSATVLFLAATGILLVTNKIQPSQLAEEQRNASRLFKQLHEEIKTTLVLQNVTADDVKDVTEKVLALDKAYPLPLLAGAMLDKFPANVEPAVWWPHKLMNKSQPESGRRRRVETRNGWNEDLEKEMRAVLGILKRKDRAEYMKLSKVVLKVNKVLAICGPLFTGLAAVGSVCMGYLPFCGSWAAVFGAMAAVVNSMEHGGQVGMVFEMYRDSAGFFSLMEESIASNLMEREADKRENGELFELKMALLLGRSLSELKDLASSSTSITYTSSNLASTTSQDEEEFASKLF